MRMRKGSLHCRKRGLSPFSFFPLSPFSPFSRVLLQADDSDGQRRSPLAGG